MMVEVDVGALREHLIDLCGTAAFGGFPAAFIDLASIEGMDGHELCAKAESMGVDLRKFEIG